MRRRSHTFPFPGNGSPVVVGTSAGSGEGFIRSRHADRHIQSFRSDSAQVQRSLVWEDAMFTRALGTVVGLGLAATLLIPLALRAEG